MKWFCFFLFPYGILSIDGNTQGIPTFNFQEQRVYVVNPEDTSSRILTHIYSYDTCGNEIKIVTFKYDDLIPFDSQKVSSLDTVKVELIDIKYKNECAPLTKTMLDANKRLQSKTTYTYTGDLLDQIEVTNASGSIITKTIYEYDANGNVVNEMRFNSRNKNDQTVDYKYQNGLLSQITTINHSFGDTVVDRYEHNVDNQPIQRTSTIAGNPMSSAHDYKYENGRLVLEIVQDYNGKTTEYKTTYDPDGLIRTWQEIEQPAGKVIKYKYYEYSK